ADRMVQISVGSEALWKRFAPAFDLPLDEPGFATNSDRVGNRVAVVAAVEQAFEQYRLVELLPKLAEVGIPAGEVRTLDRVYQWEQTRSQGLLIDVDHATLGSISLPGPPLRLDDDFLDEHSAPPTLDQHGQSIRAWLDELDTAEPAQ
ncbi:MAG: CoA transferase, partial [Actinomycetota bacterium]|nr:CoA transferase [Actinomycetota bacterium]